MAQRGKTDLPVSDRDQKRASSAHAAINIPLNVECWHNLDDDIQTQLIWFHQHVIDQKVSWEKAKATLGYDSSTIFKVLKGTYEGSYENVCERIREYRQGIASIRKSTFAKNRISRLISSTLDYAVTCGGIVLIMGESGQGKSSSATDWMHDHNGGRTAMVETPPTGGHRGFLGAFAKRQGSNKNGSLAAQEASTYRAFNKRRMLLVDEVHRLIPGDRRVTPRSLEFLRHLHDQTQVPIGLFATQRFSRELQENQYMFEQLLGRIDLTVVLPESMDHRDYQPMVEQYIPNPDAKLNSLCDEVVNSWPGRMRALDKLMVFASRIAIKAGEKMTSKHVFQAVNWRNKLSKGDI